MTRRRLPVLLLLALVVALAAVPATALAAKPDVFHANFSDSVDDVTVCGIIVDIRSEGVFTDKLFFDKDGNPVRFQSTFSQMTTYTAANGKSVLVQNSGQFTSPEPGLIDEQAGTITFLETFKGLAERLWTPHGPVLFRDAGLITFLNTYDLDTGDLISGEIVVNKGPHPDAESDFTLFCEVLTDALA